MTLVLDASTFLPACASLDGFAIFGTEDLVAPHFMWSESVSALHEARWRGDVSHEHAAATLERVHVSPVKPRFHPRMHRHAWDIADQLGWAKTYDAEYVALAGLLRCRLVTSDLRLRRGADRLGYVFTPQELT